MTDLPIGWTRVSIGDVAVVRGGIQKQAKRRPIKNRYPFLRVANVGRGVLNLAEVHKIELFEGELERYMLQPGDLLVVEGNGSPSEIGRAAMWHGEISDCVHQNHLICVRPTSAMFPEYLELLWNSPTVVEQLRAVARATSGLHTISTSKIKRIEIPVPPYAEQCRIVAALEAYLSNISHGSYLLDRAELQVARLEMAIIDEIASGGILKNRNLNHNEIAPGWRWVSPDELTSGGRGDIVIGPFGSNLKVADYSDSGVPLIFVRDIRSGDIGKRNPKFISIEKARELHAHKVVRGDVLVTKMGDPPGDACVYMSDRDGVITADCIRLRPEKRWNPNYLVIAINSSLVRRQIREITRGVAQQKISLARFRQGVRIPVPPVERQDELLREAEPYISAVGHLKQMISIAQHRRAVLRKAFLTEAFAGRLVEQDPADEPAPALLERTRAEQVARGPGGRMRRDKIEKAPQKETLL